MSSAMKLEKGQVAAVHYRGTFPESREEFDSSYSRGKPLEFLVGHQNMIQGFEKGMLGAGVGETREFTVTPDQAYGQRDGSNVLKIPRNRFPAGMELVTGMMLVTEIDGSPSPFTVAEIGEAEVTADFNHPLAGRTLHFEVELVSLRDATEEELAHGHTHGEGGHHHHEHEHSHDGHDHDHGNCGHDHD